MLHSWARFQCYMYAYVSCDVGTYIWHGIGFTLQLHNIMYIDAYYVLVPISI